ncbi:hypothetical protein JCM10212_007101 [Sporobolomyces blumeae]
MPDQVRGLFPSFRAGTDSSSSGFEPERSPQKLRSFSRFWIPGEEQDAQERQQMQKVLGEEIDELRQEILTLKNVDVHVEHLTDAEEERLDGKIRLKEQALKRLEDKLAAIKDQGGW